MIPTFPFVIYIMVKGKVRTIGTLVLLIVLHFKNTLLFTQIETYTVNQRYDPIYMAKLLGGRLLRSSFLSSLLFEQTLMRNFS